MGRQAYLTRLALGRSAFQPPDNISTTGLNEEGETVNTDTRQIKSSNYVQQYDNRGYAINPASTDLRRRLTHAQNDLLATVGVCAKVNDKKISQPHEALFSQRIRSIRSENDTGLNISLIGSIAAIMIEPWGASIRQRLQTFRFFSSIPLLTAIKSDWRARGPLELLYAGTPSSWVFNAFDIVRHEMYTLVHDYGTFDMSNAFEKSTLSRRNPSKIGSITLKFFKGVFFVMLTPLEVFATLQRLGIIKAWPIVPSPTTYTTILTDLIRFPSELQPASLRSGLRALHSILLMPLCTWTALTYTRPLLTKGFYRYFRAALPKPTHPDRYSLVGAENEFDSETIPALIDEDSVPKAQREITGVVNLLQKDLQAIGYNWQRFCSSSFDSLARMQANLLKITKIRRVPEIKVSRSRWSSASTISTVQGLSGEDIIEIVEEPNDISAQNADILGLRPELQDLLDSMPESHTNQDLPQRLNTRTSSPLAVPPEQEFPLQGHPGDFEDIIEIIEESDNAGLPSEAPQGPAEQPDNLRSPTPRSVSSSANQSRVPTPPPPIEIITSTAGTGHMHMNVTIPANIGEDRFDQGFRVPSASSSDPSSDGNSERHSEERPYHRVTLMSTYAAEAMADLLSDALAGLLLLPLEALFARSVAMTFLHAPKLAIGGSGNAGGWKEDMYPLRAWFGTGLRAGGWGGVKNYAGKLLLVWGLQVGVDFVLWQITSVYIWQVGRRWYNWGRL